MHKKKILAIIPTYYPQCGGAEKAAHELYAGISKEYKVDLLCPDYGGKKNEFNGFFYIHRVCKTTKNLPFKVGSAAVTTPVTRTLILRAARSAGREITSAALVKSSSPQTAEAPSKTKQSDSIPGAGASRKPGRFSFVRLRTMPDFKGAGLESRAFPYPSKEGW